MLIKKMKNLLLLLLLSLLACENIQGKKTGEAENSLNMVLGVRAIIVTQFPYPLAGSCSQEGSTICFNNFNHSPVSCIPGMSKAGRCSVQDSVGVCIFYSFGSVTESVYYSPEFTQEQARQRCTDLAQHPANQGKGDVIKFQEVYKLDSVYYPNKTP
jgi:hypothetical protein